MVNTQAHIDRLKARLEVLEAKAKVAARKLRTRRLILLGTITEELMLNDAKLAKLVRERADQKFQRKVDRLALELPLAESSPPPHSKPPA
jgi:hypothetical protein